MEIRYSSHLLSRLALRHIPKAMPRTIYLRAQRHFLDTHLLVEIAVHEVRLSGKKRHVALAYKRYPAHTVLITIHPLKPQQLANRIRSGRWRSLS
ncbi:MAG: hypothetical protein AAB967_01175 [Patescibacteria group bacterium]